MKHTFSLITLVTILLVGLALPVSAQTNITTTTASSAATATQKTVVVASNTGITARTTGLWIPVTGEYMDVLNVSGTTITVARGGGTGNHPIAASAVVYVIPDGGTTGARLSGSCTGANTPPYYQMLNVEENMLYVCMLSGTWQGRRSTPEQLNHTPVITR